MGFNWLKELMSPYQYKGNTEKHALIVKTKNSTAHACTSPQCQSCLLANGHHSYPSGTHTHCDPESEGVLKLSDLKPSNTVSNPKYILAQTVVHKIQMQMKIPGSKMAINVGEALFAIDLHSMVMMYDIPGIFPTCPGGGHEVVQAYKQCQNKSMVMGKHITLQPGDLLVINNNSCVHGHTTYKPCLDGTDMWLVKTHTR
eukprot:15350483-Ditylum_brightwellii.AAC.1